MQGKKKQFNYEKFEPSNMLLGKILSRIQAERRLMIIKSAVKFAVFLLFLIGSAVELIPAFEFMRNGLIESGFTQYLNLLFSDFETVVIYWQNFLLTLLESLPVFSIFIFLTVFLIFIESIKFSVCEFNSFRQKLIINL